MNCFKANHLAVFTLIALVFSLMLFVGCSNNPLGTPDDQPEAQVLHRSAEAVAGFKIAGELYTETVVSAREGGQLSFYDVTLDIPPGAISNDTVFSISIPDLNVFYNDFGTEGLVFKKPVTVTMSYRDAVLNNVDESTIRIAWLNHETGLYEDMICTVDRENKVVVGQLFHFSAYALISDCLGGLPPL